MPWCHALAWKGVETSAGLSRNLGLGMNFQTYRMESVDAAVCGAGGDVRGWERGAGLYGFERLSVLGHTALGRDQPMICLRQTRPDAGFSGKRFVSFHLGLLFPVRALSHHSLTLSELLTEGAVSISERDAYG